MQMRLDFTVSKEIVNFLLHNCVLKNKDDTNVKLIFLKKMFDRGKMFAIMSGN